MSDKNAAALRESLSHVYWIGGGSGAGKSTIARRIADHYGMHLYSSDDAMADHVRRPSSEDRPFLNAFLDMNMDERWVNRTPQTMLETFPWFRGEGFDLIVDDVLAFPKETGIIVEGFRLLPRLVKPLLHAPHHAVWLLPTPEFREAAINSRDGAGWEFLVKTSNPEQALSNLLERDRMFTDYLRLVTTRLQLRAIEISVDMNEKASFGCVVKAFGL